MRKIIFRHFCLDVSDFPSFIEKIIKHRSLNIYRRVHGEESVWKDIEYLLLYNILFMKK